LQSNILCFVLHALRSSCLKSVDRKQFRLTCFTASVYNFVVPFVLRTVNKRHRSTMSFEESDVLCCNRGARGALTQSFTLWQQAKIKIAKWDHSI